MARSPKTLQLASAGFNRLPLTLPKTGGAQVWRYRDSEVYIIKEFCRNISLNKNGEDVNGFRINFMTPDVKNVTTKESYVKVLGSRDRYDVRVNGCWEGTVRGKNASLPDSVGEHFRKLCNEGGWIKPEAYTRFSSYKSWGKYGTQFWEVKDISVAELNKIARQYIKDIENYRANGDVTADTQIEASKLAGKIAEGALASKSFIQAYAQQSGAHLNDYSSETFDFVREINNNPDKYARGPVELTTGWKNITRKITSYRRSIEDYTMSLKRDLLTQYKLLKDVSANCSEYLEKMRAYDNPDDMMCKVCLTALMTNATDLEEVKNELADLGVDDPDTYELPKNN